MTTDTQLPDRLAQLGEALDRAVRADLAARSPRARRLRSPRRVAAGVALLAVVVPAAAFAATQLLVTPSQVAASLPQGTKALIGTDPTCTVVTANVEYQCVLASAPGGGPAPAGDGRSVTAPASSAGTAVVRLPDGQTAVSVGSSERELKQKLLRLGHPDTDTGNSTVHTSSPPAPASTDWTGTVEPTVDATSHVNGGCRSQNEAGTDWECYIGKAAVQQEDNQRGLPRSGIGRSRCRLTLGPAGAGPDRRALAEPAGLGLFATGREP